MNDGGKSIIILKSVVISETQYTLIVAGVMRLIGAGVIRLA